MVDTVGMIAFDWYAGSGTQWVSDIIVYGEGIAAWDSCIAWYSSSGYTDSTNRMASDVADPFSDNFITLATPDTIYMSAKFKRTVGSDVLVSPRKDTFSVATYVPTALSAIKIDSFKNYADQQDTIKVPYTTPNISWPESVIFAVQAAYSPTDSITPAYRYAKAFVANHVDTVKIPMTIYETSHIFIRGWVRDNILTDGVWSTSDTASRWFMGDTLKIISPHIISFYDKRAKTLNYIPDGDSLGAATADTNDPVDWHPWFNFFNNSGYTTDSCEVVVYNDSGRVLNLWKDTLVCATSTRSRSIKYPANTTYLSKSIVIPSGPRCTYKIRLKSNNVWSTYTPANYFYGVIPDSSDAYGYRNYVPVWFGNSNSGFSANTYTATVEYPTGWGYIIDSMGVPNGATPELANYGGFSYVVYQRVPDSTTGYTAVVRRNDSTNVWTAPTNVSQSTGDYAHDYSKIAISSDSILWFVIGGHNTMSHIYRTKTAHVTGQGINICDTCWTQVDTTQTLSLRTSTYPYFVSSSGYLYLFFRNKCQGADEVALPYGCQSPDRFWSSFCYIRYNPATQTWSERKEIIKYPNPFGATTDSNTSVYHSVFNVPGSNRVWAHITYWNYYGSYNRGRATAVLYSDLDGSGYFSTWHQVETATVLADSDDYSLTYKVIENFHPNSDSLKSPYVLGNNQESGIVSNSYDNSAFVTLHPIYDWQNEELATVWSFYHPAWAEWVKINLGGHTLFRAKTKGNHNAYTVNIDTGSYSGTIKVIIKNKASSPDTTETFDSLTTYSDIYTAINHGLAGVNSGNASNLMRLEWIGCTLLPYTSESTLTHGDTATYSWIGIRDTTQNYCWTHHRGGHQIYEPDNRRDYIYQIVKPRGKTWFGGELERTNLWNVGTGFPSISKTMLTNSSGEGIPTIGALSRVGYSYESTRNRYTPNFKELVMSSARNVLWIPDKYVANSYNDIRVYSATIDSLNAGTITWLERNRLIDNRLGLLKTRIMFRASPGIAANTNAPKWGTYIIASGNPSAGTPPDTITKVLPALSTGNSYEGFESYADSSNLDDALAWITSGTGSAKVYSGQNIYPENAWQGDRYVDFQDSVNAQMACGTQQSTKVRGYLGLYKTTVANGKIWMYLKSTTASGRDSTIKYIGLTLNATGTKCYPITRNIYCKDTIRATSGSATSDSLWSGGGNLITSDNNYATINKVGTMYICLTKDGTTRYGDSVSIVMPATTDSVVVSGTNASLWGTELNRDTVNQSNFGVILILGGAHLRAKGFGFGLPTASKVIGTIVYTEGHSVGNSRYIDQVRIGIRYTVNEDTVWRVHTANRIEAGISNYYPLYHKFEMTCIGNMANLYINGTLLKSFTMTSFNNVGFGAGTDAEAYIDNITVRSCLSNEPEPRTCFSPEQVLGAEESNLGYVRRIKLLEEMGR
jgi:hypothetical protein